MAGAGRANERMEIYPTTNHPATQFLLLAASPVICYLPALESRGDERWGVSQCGDRAKRQVSKEKSMFIRRGLRPAIIAGIIASVLGVSGTQSLRAAPPWAKFMPVKRVEADPKKGYELDETHGPWLIMCSSFAGPQAEQQAHDLVIELRRTMNIEAYTYKQHFDFTQTEIGRGLNQFGAPKRMRPMNGSKYDEVAVLAGRFHSVDQPEVEKTLQTIKRINPTCMRPPAPETPGRNRPKLQTGEVVASVRNYYQNLTEFAKLQTGEQKKGPLGQAFVSSNPLLPESFFVQKSGVEPFLVEMNKDLPYSLLKNPGKYTVKVASFRGADEFGKTEAFDQKVVKHVNDKGFAKIDEAAKKASLIAKALRDKGVKAYEFHDRTESIVCVGEFNEVGTPRVDGKLEINPVVYQIMQEYGPQQNAIAGAQQIALQPRMIKVPGYVLPFDTQPLPVAVPKQSFAKQLSKRSAE